MPQSIYAGGYSEEKKRALERVKLPDKIRCKTCKRIRVLSGFSNTQIERVRHSILMGLTGPMGNNVANCRMCTGGQTNELRCCVCDETKGLDKFAKNQRQDRDNARCIDCVEFHEEVDPVVEERKLLDDEHEVITGSHLEGPSGHPSLTKQNLKRLNVALGQTDDEASSVGGGVWLGIDRKENENENEKEGTRNLTAYGASGTAHQRTIAPSEVDRSEYNDWQTWGPRQPTSSRPLPLKKESKFARLPGRRVPKKKAPDMPVLDQAGERGNLSDVEEEEEIEQYL